MRLNPIYFDEETIFKNGGISITDLRLITPLGACPIDYVESFEIVPNNRAQMKQTWCDWLAGISASLLLPFAICCAVKFPIFVNVSILVLAALLCLRSLHYMHSARRARSSNFEIYANCNSGHRLLVENFENYEDASYWCAEYCRYLCKARDFKRD